MESTQPKRRSPRPPQPPIDPALVVPGARFQKNRAEDIGREPTFVIVDLVQTLSAPDGDYDMVYYHNETTLRRGKMPLKDFCMGSEHRLPDAESEAIEEPPQSGERIAEPADICATLRSMQATQSEQGEMLAEILALLKRREQGQLTLIGTGTR